MKILIISRSFAPDNGIAAKRITMLSKYLCKLGHEITVIRSGIIYGKAEMNNLEGLETVRICSYEGENSAAERFEKYGETQYTTTRSDNKKEKNSLNCNIYNFFRKTGHFLLDPFIYSKEDGKLIKDKIISLYNKSKDLRGFNVVISSFSPLGCIQAAEYIKQQEHAKWIIDFRDLMNNATYTTINRFINSIRQKHFVNKADACLCVSVGNAQRLIKQNRKDNAEKIHTVFNGYEESEQLRKQNVQTEKQELHICYTGTLYEGKRNCSPLFRAIKEAGNILPVVIDYAGRDEEIILAQARKYGLEDIVIDHGYLSRTEVTELQKQSDVFLILSWNTKHDQGILTGKFYEALQNRKPIIALVDGNVPNSELKTLINRYHLGICYEEATKGQSEQLLRDYLSRQMSRKQRGEMMEYEPDESVFDRFQYQEIAKQLEQIMIDIVSK